MKEDFQNILAFTWKEEVGHDPKNPNGNVDDPVDRGGRTSRGMTQSVYDLACVVYGWPKGDVWEASDEQITIIYKDKYWKTLLGDQIPWPLCGALFDTAVLH